MDQICGATACRAFDAALLNDVVDSMCRSKFHIAGATDRVMYEAICRDSLKIDRVCIEVAVGEDRVEGFLIVIIDWKKYWTRRLLHHPIAAARATLLRLRRMLMPEAHESRLTPEARLVLLSLVGTSASGRRWEQSNASIAKVLFVFVDSAGRGKALSSCLYRRMFEELRRRGVTRCDARIDFKNLASVRAHLKVGFKIEVSERSLFATIDV